MALIPAWGETGRRRTARMHRLGRGESRTPALEEYP